MKNLIIEYCISNNCYTLFDLKKIGLDKYEIPTRGRGTQWWKFLQFIKSSGLKYKTTIRKENGNMVKKKYFFGIKHNVNSNLKSISNVTKANNDKALDLLNSLPDAEVAVDNKDVYSNKFNLFEYVE